MKCDICGNPYTELHKVGKANICAGCYVMAYGDSKTASTQESPKVESPKKDVIMTDDEKLKVWGVSLQRLRAERIELDGRIDKIEQLIVETERKMAEKKA